VKNLIYYKFSYFISDVIYEKINKRYFIPFQSLYILYMTYKTLGQGRVTNILIIETLTPSNLHQLTQQCYSNHIKMALLIPLTRNTTQFHYMYYVHKDNSSSMKKMTKQHAK